MNTRWSEQNFVHGLPVFNEFPKFAPVPEVYYSVCSWLSMQKTMSGTLTLISKSCLFINVFNITLLKKSKFLLIRANFEVQWSVIFHFLGAYPFWYCKMDLLLHSEWTGDQPTSRWQDIVTQCQHGVAAEAENYATESCQQTSRPIFRGVRRGAGRENQ